MIGNCCEPTLLLLAMLCCVGLTGCRPAARRPLAVVVSGDVAGWIAPCGCASNQSGGLSRRATYLAQLRRAASVIAADVGGAVHGSSTYDRLKLEAILAGESKMDTAAHNIGAAEARFGPNQLRRWAAGGAPLVSANVRDRAGQSVAAPLRIVTAEGRRVALVGVLAERYATADLDVTPPRQAVLDALAAAASQYDAAIVLAYMPEDDLRQLAGNLPEVDVVAGGPTGQPLTPQRVGSTLLASATNQGKFVVRLDGPDHAATDRWAASVIELNEQFSDDPSQTANLDHFRTALRQADLRPEQTAFVEPSASTAPAGYAVAGNAACRKCHEDEHRQWRQSKHAAAWASLKRTGAQVDPECQRCHTTGYGLSGGFASLADNGPRKDRADVGCESCHGPSQGHVANPTTHTPHYARAKDFCIGCHDRENSPKFDLPTYWKRTEHGKKP
ncbi:MAG: multiheme c-type cytochrome [Thermoguttaceae bacterium]